MTPIVPTAGRLRKEISFFGVYALSTGATLSAGLFLLPGLAASEVGSAIVLCYLLAAVPLVPAMLSIVELSTAMPRAGGAYYFLDRSLGPLAGTVGGLGTWLALTLKAAFALIGMGAYLVVFFPDAPFLITDIETGAVSIAWPMRLVAAGFAVFFGAVNWLGAKKSGTVQIVLVVFLLIILGWFIGRGTLDVRLDRLEGFFGAGYQSILATTGLVYISYVGVTKVASVSEEVKNPERNLPRGVFLSLGTALAVYGLCTLVMVGVVPMHVDEAPTTQLAGSLTPMALAAEALVGHWGAVLIAIAAICAFSSVANAGVLSSSRYPLAMARDRLLPGVLAKLNRRGTPAMSSIVTVAALVAIVVFLDPLKIAKLASAFQLLMFAMLCGAVIVMRESRIESYDPGYRSPFYPWMQVIGIIVPFILIEAMGWLPLLFSTGMVAAGIAWYFFYARHRVVRHGAIYHVFARLGEHRFDELDTELRSILKEKGLRTADPFDELVARAHVIDIAEDTDFADVVGLASTCLSERLPAPAEHFERGFLEGTRTGTTPVTNGVALPHMRINNISEPAIVLARCRNGIDIVDAEGQLVAPGAGKVFAIFFLVSPEEDPAQHLRLLAKLASRVDDPDFATEWSLAIDSDGLKKLFLQTDQNILLEVVRGTSTEPLIDTHVRDLGFPDGTLVALVHRRGRTMVPNGETRLRENDRLTIIGDVRSIEIITTRFGTVPTQTALED